MSVMARETVDSVLSEIGPLTQLNFDETAHFKDIALDLDVEFYRRAEAAGVVRIFTARDDGKLVGYCVFVVCRSPKYKGSLQASQEVLFVHPAKRGTTVGPRLLGYCDNSLADEGVQVVYHQVMEGHDFGRLLEGLGYHRVGYVYARRLDHG